MLLDRFQELVEVKRFGELVEELDMSRHCRSQSVSLLPGNQGPQRPEECKHGLESCFLLRRSRCMCSTLPSCPTARLQERGLGWAG